MTTYTYAQLEQLWINNGGSKATAPIAAAIAEAESSGNPDATSANPDGGTNVGLWQLDTPGGGGSGYSVAQLQDPNLNASVAANVSQDGSDWSTWATYASGAYKAYLSNSTAPDPNVPAATAAASGGTGAASPGCLIGIDGLGINQCFLDKSEARALIGGLCLTAAALIALPAVILLGAAAFRASGAGQAAARAAGPLEAAPGYGHAIRYARARGQRATAERKAARSAPRRTRVGKPLSQAEIRQANANRRKLDAGKKKKPPGP